MDRIGISDKQWPSLAPEEEWGSGREPQRRPPSRIAYVTALREERMNSANRKSLSPLIQGSG